MVGEVVVPATALGSTLTDELAILCLLLGHRVVLPEWYISSRNILNRDVLQYFSRCSGLSFQSHTS